MLGSTLLGSASDGPDLTFPGVTGTVNSAVADGTGGWYIGGLFSQVGNVPRNNLAHILSNGDVDPNWTLGTNNTVNALAISGSTVYVGGSFSGILSLAGASTTRAKLAAIGTNGVLSTTWGPFADATVRALGISGSTLYAGGDFTTIGGLSRPYLAAITGDASTLAVVSTTWNPTANSTVNALAISGSTVYVGGAFTTIGSTRRNYLAAIGTDVNATLATTWDPSANGIVRALGISGGTLYAGGDFTTIGVLSRPYLAAITGDATTAAVVSTTWTPISNRIVNALAISGSTVYAGGAFTTIGGTSRNYLAAIATDGTLSTWNPNANGTVNALAISGSTVYAGGGFILVGGVTRNYLAAIGTDGTLSTWNPNANGTVKALAISGSTVYAGGGFSLVGGVTRNDLAAIGTDGTL